MFISFHFNGEKELIIVEFLKEGSYCRGVRSRQGLEFLGEVFAEDLNAIIIHFIKASTLLHLIL